MSVGPIRILLVDDSVVIRRVVGALLARDPELEVAGTAANGKIALAKIPQVSPDVVILDVDMPEMDGLETLRNIKLHHPELPVIMFSALTERGAEITLEALFRGALDYVTKPTDVTSPEAAAAAIQVELIPKIKLLCEPALRRPQPPAPAPGQEPAPAARPGAVRAVVVGASTGGPVALQQLLAGLPRPLPVPVLIVQHMPPVFTRSLAERLAQTTGLDVREGRDGAAVRPGQVWIAPGDYHMVVERREASIHLALHQGPPQNSCRPSADVLFQSAARVWGGDLIAVILTGMGKDGLHGARTIHDLGGRVGVQDRDSSVVWGMPRFVAEMGIADQVMSPAELGAWLAAELGAGGGE